MKTLPLTVLLHDGPMGRAYLGALRHAGLRPERIVALVYDKHPSTRKPVGRWLPSAWRRLYAEGVQRRALFYWPRWLRMTRAPLYEAMRARVTDALKLPDDVFEEVLGKTALGSFSENVEPLLVSGLDDQRLERMLSDCGETTVLFTGGGLLRRNLLDLAGVRFLHIHPGYLPHVRGADGLLWSTLVRGRPGASCFYMEAGLDTGDVVEAVELDAVSFPRSVTAGLDDQMLYRALFSFYDPMLRAKLLTRVLGRSENPARLPAAPQDLGVGVTYHFMNPVVRKAALEEIFR